MNLIINITEKYGEIKRTESDEEKRLLKSFNNAANQFNKAEQLLISHAFGYVG